jgi:hypothetical protein
MKDFRIQLEDQIAARLTEIKELKYVAASSRVGLSRPTSFPAAIVTYAGFQKIAVPVQFGTAQHTLIKADFFITLATSSGKPSGVSQRGARSVAELSNQIFVKLSGFLLDFADCDLETPWPCEVEDELPYEINGQSVVWQQMWSLQIQLAGFAPT